MKRNKKALRDFQNCRSLSFAEEYNPGEFQSQVQWHVKNAFKSWYVISVWCFYKFLDLGSTKVVRVTEWQRRNGAIIGHAQDTSTKLPHQVLLCYENEILGIILNYWVILSCWFQ